ncbi:MAG: hypothetical protein ABIQ97_02515 [Lysobacteraceae bacterium]
MGNDSALDVLRLVDSDRDAVADLLRLHGLALVVVADGAAIPGSYWGDCEAGLIGTNVYARADTPIHSILHEAAHLLVMPRERQALVHTDATDSTAEEDAACYLQILLAEMLSGVGAKRVMQDMDRWGYSFRLGSTRAWFEQDAEDARAFLLQRALLGSQPLIADAAPRGNSETPQE